jgi:hypothetical protein
MLLIVFVGLIAKLTAVSGDCVPENATVADFDLNKVAIT